MAGNVENILKCPSCKERYKGKPKQLPCQHSVCERPCLETLLKSNNGSEYECPQCSKKHPVPKNGTEDLPIYEVLMKVLELNNDYTELPVKRTPYGTYLYSDNYNSLTSKAGANQLHNCEKCKTKSLVQCLHCGKKLCSKECKDKHMEDIEDIVKKTCTSICDCMNRIDQIVENTGIIIGMGSSIAANKKLKRLFQVFEEKRIYIDQYLKSFQHRLSDGINDNEMMADLFQCKEYHDDLIQVEFNDMVCEVKEKLEKMSPKFTNVEESVSDKSEGNERAEPHAHQGQKFQAPPVPPRSSGLSPIEQENDDGYETLDCKSQTVPNDARTNQPSNTSLQPLSFCSRLVVCSVIIVVSCFRIGISIWNIVQHNDKMVVVTACFLILKTLYETGVLYWLTLQDFKGNSNLRKYICALALVVCLGLLLILDIVLAFTTDANVISPLRVMRIVTIVDWVWTFFILLSIWMLVKRCFRNS